MCTTVLQKQVGTAYMIYSEITKTACKLHFAKKKTVNTRLLLFVEIFPFFDRPS